MPDREGPALEGEGILKKLAETGLPLAPRLGEICAALEGGKTLILRSDPGSGKSTLVPLALLGRIKKPGKIFMLEPRRAAAAGIAARMAELLGEELGGRVGYSVRMERRVSSRTLIEVLTGGLFVRRLQGNPGLLEGGGEKPVTVIFDEFHERQVHGDLALALVLELRRMGSRVRLLIMSATLDAQGLAERIGPDVEVLDLPGRVFPVEIGYHPLPERGALGRETAAALERLLPGGAGDTLVFLPGRREIGDARSALEEGPLGGSYGVYALHGSLPLSRQREIIAPGSSSGPRRIILSTNLAETSLTIPGITLVVDSGYVRLERYYLPAAMNRLSLEPHSVQSADQRAGRAGRLGPGRCVRLWKEGIPRSAETESEIRRVDLSGLVLECLLWGARERLELPWLEPPPEGAWNRALEQLRDLGALEGEGAVTPRGREIALLGIEPRLGALCAAGRDRGLPALACAAASLLSEGDPSGIRGDSDFRRRLETLRKRPEEPWAGRVMKNAGELLARLGGEKRPLPSRRIGEWTPGDEADIGELLGAAFPDRVALLQASGKYRFVSGREAAAEGLSGQEWIAAAEVDAGERSGFIRLAAPLPAEKALEILEKRSLTEKRIEWEGLVPRQVLTKAAGRLVFSCERGIPPREEIIPSLPRRLMEGGIGLLPWEEEGGKPRRFLERVRFFRSRRMEEAGTAPLSWTGEALAGEAAEWLGPFIWEGRDRDKGPLVRGRELLGALEARLGWEAKRELDALAPEYLILPNGKKRPIDYSGGEPAVRVRLQDAFGIAEIVRILSVPLVFHLLSPADRPIQVTGDLPGFWAGSYREVRKEMRGRYPKHRWPENPLEQE